MNETEKELTQRVLSLKPGSKEFNEAFDQLFPVVCDHPVSQTIEDKTIYPRFKAFNSRPQSYRYNFYIIVGIEVEGVKNRTEAIKRAKDKLKEYGKGLVSRVDFFTWRRIW